MHVVLMFERFSVFLFHQFTHLSSLHDQVSFLYESYLRFGEFIVFFG